MIRVAPFEPEHLAEMTIQPVQAEFPADRIAHGQQVAAFGRSFTVRRKSDGRIMMCGGAMDIHAQHAMLWAALAPDAGPVMLALTRRTRWLIDMLPHRRIDAIARADHRAGCRWLVRLGFDAEAYLRDYFENGSDAVVYRLRRG